MLGERVTPSSQVIPIYKKKKTLLITVGSEIGDLVQVGKLGKLPVCVLLFAPVRACCRVFSETNGGGGGGMVSALKRPSASCETSPCAFSSGPPQTNRGAPHQIHSGAVR